MSSIAKARSYLEDSNRRSRESPRVLIPEFSPVEIPDPVKFSADRWPESRAVSRFNI